MASLRYNTHKFRCETPALLSTVRGVSKPYGRSTVSYSTSNPSVVQLSFSDEQWRDIPGYIGLYQVSDQGRVWSNRKRRIMHPSGANGYQHLILCTNASHHCVLVHLLVMLAFVGPRPADCEIDHINCDRADNRLSNLRYLNSSENAAQGFKRLHEKCHWVGESHPASKLSNSQRHEIVSLYATKQYSQRELAKMFGVSASHVCDLVNGLRCSSTTNIKPLGRNAPMIKSHRVKGQRRYPEAEKEAEADE